MTIKNKKQEIETYLDQILPNVGCELNYNKDYELLIAVMLSAQTTDQSVNKVTRELFSRFDTLGKLNCASLEEIENIIKPLGLYKNKAKNIKNICKSLIENFDGVLPSTVSELTQFSGVGNKTACVVRAEIFNIPEFPVDTHVQRISKRLELANESDNPQDVEKKLKDYFDKNTWIKLHHQFIHFGRNICYARNPKCGECRLQKYCKSYSSRLIKESKASK